MKGWNYLIRAKDINSNGMVASYPIPDQDEFDISVEKVLTRKQTNTVKQDSKV